MSDFVEPIADVDPVLENDLMIQRVDDVNAAQTAIVRMQETEIQGLLDDADAASDTDDADAESVADAFDSIEASVATPAQAAVVQSAFNTIELQLEQILRNEELAQQP